MKFRRRSKTADRDWPYHYLPIRPEPNSNPGGPVTQPPSRPVKFPPLNAGLNNTECKDGSQRDPDESLSQPCHVCGHIACRIGKDGPYPCEVCNIVVYMRAMFSRVGTLETRADNGQTAIQSINTELGDHETRISTQAAAGATLTTRVTIAENNIAAGATAINNRPTNAQVTSAINSAVNPVDTKVNTLKTRVDNATAFPIP